MYQYQQHCIREKPLKAHIAHGRLTALLIIGPVADKVDNGRPHKCQKYRGCSIKPGRIGEHINNEASYKSEQQQKPSRGFERQHHDKQNVYVRVQIAKEINLVQQENLQRNKHYKTHEIPQDHPIHPSPYFRDSSLPF